MTFWSQGGSVMPKQTFYNLKEEKRDKIESIAIKEFAERGFYGARLNNIVQNAGIAKGSFYQYFTDLEDLYIHLIITLHRRKMDVIYETLQKCKTTDIFTQLALIIKAAVQYINSYGDGVVNLLNPPQPNFLHESEEVRELLEKSEKTLYEPLIKEAIARGEIINDEDLAYSVLSQHGAMTRRYLFHKTHTQNYIDIYSDEKAYNEATDLILNFIKQGLKNK